MLVVIGFLSILLTSCGSRLEVLDIKADRALHGHWIGVLEEAEYSLNEKKVIREINVDLELTATAIDRQHYRVAGTMQLDNETPLTLEGNVWAGDTPAYMYSGSPSLLEGQATLNGTVIWEIHGGRSLDDSSEWGFGITPPGSFDGLSGIISRPGS
jgi:hypothetical protein